MTTFVTVAVQYDWYQYSDISDSVKHLQRYLSQIKASVSGQKK